MFETAVIRNQTQAGQRRAGMLTASIGIHSFAIAAILIASIHSLKFPVNAPNQMELFKIAAPPPPMAKGDPNGGAKPKVQPQQAAVKPPTVVRDAAPQTIPTQAPTPQPASADTNPGPATDGSTGGDKIGNGNPIGVKDGVDGGLEPDTPVKPAAPEVIYRASDVNPPVVITRVSPEYPHIAMVAHKSGWAIVECVIDNNGRIRDAHVVGSSWAVFERPALDAVNQWVFKPGSLNGQAVNTLFELRVTFTLH
jgi:protein TonB